MALMQVDIMQGQVRGMERGEPLARRGDREGRMIDTTRYKTWRSGPDAELHVIVYEGAELPFGVSSLGPWLGSKEGEVANIETPLQGDARGYWVRGGATESGGVQDGGVTCRRPSAVGPFPGRALSFLKPASRRLLCAASTAEN
jgi:hypothetical protein